MDIIHEVNIQAKSNNGVSYKEWRVLFKDKELMNITRLKGNDEKLTYEPSTKFIIQTDKEFTEGYIAVKYRDSSRNKRINFTIELKPSDIYYYFVYTTKDVNGNILDVSERPLEKNTDGYKTKSLYQYFTYIVKENFFLANVDSETVRERYENHLLASIQTRENSLTPPKAKKIQASRKNSRAIDTEIYQSDSSDTIDSLLKNLKVRIPGTHETRIIKNHRSKKKMVSN